MKNSDYDLEQLKIVNDLKMHEDLLLWTILSIFFGANALLIGAYYQIDQKDSLYHWIVPAFGIFLSLIWSFIQFRIIQYYQFYEKLIQKMEEEIPYIRFRTVYPESGKINQENYSIIKYETRESETSYNVKEYNNTEKWISKTGKLFEEYGLNECYKGNLHILPWIMLCIWFVIPSAPIIIKLTRYAICV